MGKKEKMEIEKWKYNMGTSYIDDAQQEIERARKNTEKGTKIYEELTLALFYLDIAKAFFERGLKYPLSFFE